MERLSPAAIAIVMLFAIAAILSMPAHIRAQDNAGAGGNAAAGAEKDEKDDEKKEDVELSPQAMKLIEKTRGPWDDDPVERAIVKAARWLFSQQKADGSFGNPNYGHIKSNCWEPKKNTYKWTNPAIRQKIMGTLRLQREPRPGAVGCTSVAVYALLKSHVDQDKYPDMHAKLNIHGDEIQKGLKFLTTYDTFGVYTIGLRCNAWVTAEKYEPGKYMKYLRHDALRLLYSIHKDTGGWNYSMWSNTYHNSPSQYGILGIWGYQMLGGEIPSSFWPLAMKYWVRGQLHGGRQEGGWSYYPTFRGGGGNHHQHRGSMSTAGLASLFVILDALLADKYLDCKGGELPAPIVNGLGWFHREFANTMVGKTPACGGNHFCYYLYGVERVGHACGYKYFGKQDWYKLGALTLLKKQKGDGSWGDVPETGFALLFLAKGRNTVLYNKLNFGGDWNNRPRDLANLTGWISRNYEQDFNWQIVNLKVNPFEWHDAPILLISGSRKPTFSEDEIKKLRTFAYQGGTILSVTECGGAGFKTGIREIYQKAFPRYEMRKIAPTHPLYAAHEKLNGTPPVSILSNGVRPLVIHTDYDVAKSWQSRKYATQKLMFYFGVNVSRYVLGQWSDLLPRGKTYWPFPADTGGLKTVKIARVKYGGNYDPEPLAMIALDRRLSAEEKLHVEDSVVDMDKLGACTAKVALLTGTDGMSLSPAQQNGLKAYVAGGGTLLVDAAGGSKKFYMSMHKNLRDIFGAAAVKPLSGGSPVYTTKKLGATGDTKDKPDLFRPLTRKRIRSRAPQLQAVETGGRAAVILSREDLTTGLLGCHSGTVDGYAPRTAFELVRNIILTAGKQ